MEMRVNSRRKSTSEGIFHRPRPCRRSDKHQQQRQDESHNPLISLPFATPTAASPLGRPTTPTSSFRLNLGPSIRPSILGVLFAFIGFVVPRHAALDLH